MTGHDTKDLDAMGALYGALAGCWCVSFEPRSEGYRQRGSLLGPYLTSMPTGLRPPAFYHCRRCHQTVYHEYGEKEVHHVCY